jgi:hypothetical protein
VMKLVLTNQGTQIDMVIVSFDPWNHQHALTIHVTVHSPIQLEHGSCWFCWFCLRF